MILSNMCRICCVIFLFSLFGFICLLGNLIFVPIIVLRLHKITQVKLFCRDLVYYSWGFFILCAKYCGFIKYKFIGFNKLDFNKCLIIANHPSLLDVVFLLAKIRRINCIIKADLIKNIFLFGAIKSSGYILNNDPEKLLHLSIDTLQNGENLLIFPEGTRTKNEIIFHKIASYLAIHAADVLLPVFIKMKPKALKKDSKWYKTNRIFYKFYTKDMIIMQDFYPLKSQPLRVRILHNFLSDIYKKENL